MNWQQVIEMPELRNLSFKIELDKQGRLILSERRIIHSVYKGKIAFLLETFDFDGISLPNCAVDTIQGTKVADVAWASAETLAIIKDETSASVAPEVCVEMLSVNNGEEEMIEKRWLYFECGAHEMWVCDEYGEMRFYDESGELERSTLFPNFPSQIKL